VDIDSQGIQQAFKLNMPGWVMKTGAFALSAETPKVVSMTVNPAKYGKATIRDGDHIGICMFNRTAGSVGFSVQMRYKEYE